MDLANFCAALPNINRRHRYAVNATILRISILAVVLLNVVIVGRPVHGAPVATVQTVTSGVTVLHATGAHALSHIAAESDRLSEGDAVRTQATGKCTILFDDGSQILVDSSTQIDLMSETRSQGSYPLIRVDHGTILARLRPDASIVSASAIARVHGTEFAMTIDADDVTRVAVIEGSVAFFNDSGSVTVLPDQQSTARPGQAPTRPVTTSANGLLLEWAVDLSRALVPREQFYESLDSSKVKQAITQADAALSASPSSGVAHAGLGDALFDAHRYTDALVQYQAAAGNAPADPSLSLRIGNALYALDRLDEAQSRFLAIIDSTAGSGGGTQLTTAMSNDVAGADVGLCWVELKRDQPELAQLDAQHAVDIVPSSTALIALGVSQMRRIGTSGPSRTELRAQAIQSLKLALDAQPQDMNYQAHAWLGAIMLSDNDVTGSLVEAQKSAQNAPDSSLAHGQLALTLFFSGDVRRASDEAKIAVRLDPESVAAQVALGEAQLADGNAEAAARAGGRAVALDPMLPQAYYLEGVADFSRIDYSHAERELRRALAIDPTFVPSASALARVLLAEGEKGGAINALRAVQALVPNDAAIHNALAQILYAEGNYGDSIAQGKLAIALDPSSALAYEQLSRSYVSANQVNEGIHAAQQAVRLAPDIGHYHAVLGQAYTFGNLDAEAELELRTALADDPENALALALLSRQANGTDPRISTIAFVQSIIFDPTVTQQILRGGISTDISPSIGTKNLEDLSGDHTDNLNKGKLLGYSDIIHQQDNGDRPNDIASHTTTRVEFTDLPNPRTQIVADIYDFVGNKGLPASTSTSDTSAYGNYFAQIFGVTGRWRLGEAHHLWIGYSGGNGRFSAVDPSYRSGDVLNVQSVQLPVNSDISRQRGGGPDLRFDYSLNRTADHESTLTFGYARPILISHQRIGVLVPPLFPLSDMSLAATGTYDYNGVTNVVYSQLLARANRRTTVGVAVRQEQLNYVYGIGADLPPALQPLSSYFAQRQKATISNFLPSILLSYQANRATTLRLSANRIALDELSSILAPNDTTLSTESATQPFGHGTTQEQYELDDEQYVSRNGFLKLFGFYTMTRDLEDGAPDGNFLETTFNEQFSAAPPNLPILRWIAYGFGVRYDQSIGRNLFTNAAFYQRRTESIETGAVYDHTQAPYEPNQEAQLGLGYIDRRGTKISINNRFVGQYYDDTSPTEVSRPHFNAQCYVDATLAKDFSERFEVFAQATNLFQMGEIFFNGYPINERRYSVGFTSRF